MAEKPEVTITFEGQSAKFTLAQVLAGLKKLNN